MSRKCKYEDGGIARTITMPLWLWEKLMRVAAHESLESVPVFWTDIAVKFMEDGANKAKYKEI